MASRSQTASASPPSSAACWKYDVFLSFREDFKTHSELVDAIVEFVCSKVLPDAIESAEDFEEFEATREAIQKVMKALRDDEVTAIGVYGMGGVGKTTMVEHVAALAKNEGIFHHVIKVVVSQDPNYEKIQGTLADLLGVKLADETEAGRAASLNKAIMRREKILIILDNVWSRIELSRIGVPGYKKLQTCNSKVILTTRIKNTCTSMRTQVKILLRVLSEKDSWSLFANTTGMSFDESSKLYNVARKICNECSGLPIALKAFAGALGDTDSLAEWERAARQLQASQPANLDDDGLVFKCMKLSNDYSKSKDAKSCIQSKNQGYNTTKELGTVSYEELVRLMRADKIKGTDDSEEELKEAFRVFDKDENGFISTAELRHVFSNLGEKFTDEEIDEMIHEADQDGDGQVSYEEFVRLTRPDKIKDTDDSEEEFKEAFRVFDKDQNGFISAAELHQVMTDLGEKRTYEEIDEMMHEADLDGDGQISYEEFVKVMMAK
ncbi:hypothetical protein M0R45_005693 [Rubus argutus]|uniref:EF-hand domain-containing protein n=1 Tax=Rubus argutus TaxID=59490 RepID=A0AAW1YND4_RUBAR